MRSSSFSFTVALIAVWMGGVDSASATLENNVAEHITEPQSGIAVSLSALSQEMSRRLVRLDVEGVQVAADDSTGEDQPTVRSASAPTIKTPDIGGTGVLDYNYDLDLPKFHGIEPSLSLNYSSSRKTKTGGLYQGWLGYGWGFSGFDVIERTRKNGSVPSYSDNWDVFQLNGDELVDCRDDDDHNASLVQEDMAETNIADIHVSPACFTTAGANDPDGSVNGDVKATRHESYLRIANKLYMADPRWEIVNRDGTKTVLKSTGSFKVGFNPTNQNKIDIANGSRWLVKSVTDANGNSVSYEYFCDDEATVCYPRLITYNSYVATNPPITKIHFELEDRPEDTVVANGHTLTFIKKRVKLVWVETNGNNVKAWQLAYGSGSQNDKLVAVKRYGSKFTVANGEINLNSGALLPKTTKFNYADYADFTSGDPINGTDFGGTFDLVDVDSDGKSEIFRTKQTGESSCFYKLINWKPGSDPSGNGEFNVLSLDGTINCVANPFQRFSIGHFGDNVRNTQLLFRTNGTTADISDSKVKWYASFIKNGNSYDVTVNTCGPNQDTMYCWTGYPNGQVLDMNGDGRDELQSLKLGSKEGGLGAVNLFDDGRQQQAFARSDGLRIIRRNFDGTLVNTMFRADFGCSYEGRSVTKCVFGDVNGDGLDDVVSISSRFASVVAGSGPSAYCPVLSRSEHPTFPVDATKCDYDLVLKVYLGVGSFQEGLVVAKDGYQLGMVSAAIANVSPNLQVRDLDGDGKAEIIFMTPPPHFKKIFADFGPDMNAPADVSIIRLKSNGGTFTLSKQPLADFNPRQELQIGDLNGDGLVDLFFRNPLKMGGAVLTREMFVDHVAGNPDSYHDRSEVLYQAAIADAEASTPYRVKYGKSSSAAVPPNVMMSIETEAGAKTSFEYRSSISLVNRFLPFSVSMVTKVTLNDGRSQPTSVAVTNYEYQNGDYEPVERKFLGFKVVTKKLPAIDGETETSRPYVVTSYRQDVQSAGSPERVNFHNAAGELKKQIETAWEVRNKKPWRARPIKTITTFREGATVRKVRTERHYDDNGNVTAEVNYGLVKAQDVTEPGTEQDIPGDEIRTVKDYVVNNEKFILSTPMRETTYKGLAGDMGTVVLSQSEIFYDYATSLTTAPLKGLPTRVKNYTSATAYAESCYKYDAAGNRTNAATILDLNIACNDNMFLPTANAVVSEWRYDADLLFLQTEYRNIGGNKVTAAAWDYSTATAKGCQQPYTSTAINTAITTYTYDDFCRLTQSQITGGALAKTAYVADGDPLNQRIETRTPLPDGSETLNTVYYDGLGRTYRTVTAGDTTSPEATVDTAYDKRGNVRTVTLPYRKDTTPSETPKYITSDFDWANRVVKTTNPDNSFVKQTYDLSPVTNETVEADDPTSNFLLDRVTVDDPRPANSTAAVHQTQTVLSTWGDTVMTRRISTTGTNELVQAASYDGLKHLTQVKDKDTASAKWVYIYDWAGNRTSVSDPDLGNWAYVYDGANRLKKQTDARNKTTVITYDGLDRVLTKTAGGVLIANNTYDQTTTSAFNKGQLTSSTNGQTTASADYAEQQFTYDANGLVTERISKINTAANVTVIDREKMTYDAPSKLVKQKSYFADLAGTTPQLTVPTTGNFTYNKKGQMTALSTYVTAQIYELDGQTKSITYGNGVKTDFSYDANRRWLTNVLTKVPSAVNPILKSDYSRNLKGQITGITGYDPTGLNRYSWTYQYDFRDRLDLANNAGQGSLSEDFAYKANGNLDTVTNLGSGVVKSFVYDGKPHAATTIGGLSVTYDANGNTTVDGVRTYSWDDANRLLSVGRSPSTTSYVYYGDGTRAKKKVDIGATTTVTLYPDASTEISGNPTNWAATVNYIRYPHMDVKISITGAGTKTQYLHRDHLASVRVVTGDLGAQIEVNCYGTFGQPYDGNCQTLTAPGTEKKFIGERWDFDANLMYLNARYYDQGNGYRLILPDDWDPTNEGAGTIR